MLVHLMAGAALGAVVVLVVWIFSGGRPFGEVVGTSDVSAPTTAAVKQTDVRSRAAAPAGTDARLEPELPALAARKAKAKAKGGGDSIQFRKPAAKRPAKAARDAAAAAKRRSRAKARSRKRQVVRVVAPPTDAGGEDTPVAAVPSPAPAAAPAPVAKRAPAAKPAKPRQPTYVAGAGEG